MKNLTDAERDGRNETWTNTANKERKTERWDVDRLVLISV